MKCCTSRLQKLHINYKTGFYQRNLIEVKTKDGFAQNIISAVTDFGKRWVGSQKEHLPASYANFYIANKSVLVPVYDHPNDKRALLILEPLFFKRFRR